MYRHMEEDMAVQDQIVYRWVIRGNFIKMYGKMKTLECQPWSFPAKLKPTLPCYHIPEPYFPFDSISTA